ncbi:MAG: stage II sporulation protein R [Oscillospiraceae bacterium]
MKTADKLALSMTAVLVLVIAAASFQNFFALCGAVREDTLRLHIIANSDSEQDQALKLKVRDALLERYTPILAKGESAEAAASIARFLSEDIALTAKKTLADEGIAAEVSVNVTEMYFDTRTYEEGVTLPAGNYTALRVVLGEGEGRNWWCVMYPPLCIPAAAGETGREIEARIRGLSELPAYEARFAVVEAIERLKARLDLEPTP